MQKKTFLGLVLIGALGLNSCTPQNGGSGSSAGTSIASSLLHGLFGGGSGTGSAAAAAGGSILDHLLGSLLSRAPITQKEIIGTWTYRGSDCVFESENLLAQAGGLVASSQVERKVDEQLAKYGIGKGVTTFTFAPDGTFTATLGKRKISGTYVLNPTTRTLQLSALLGLISFDPQIVRRGSGFSLLFKADKILSLANTVATIVGKSNSTVGVLASLMDNYQGMRIGLKMQR